MIEAHDRKHLAGWIPCPHLPLPAKVWTHHAMAALGRERGAAFYETALHYAGSLWLQGLPARSLLLINRALGADLRGDEAVLQRWPLPYAAVRWILEHRPDEETHFIGNPRRHYQHLATRMVPPRKRQRMWRAWACWYLARQILPDERFPADRRQIREEGMVEPSREAICQGLEAHGITGERSVWEEAAAAGHHWHQAPGDQPPPPSSPPRASRVKGQRA